jgi:GNAT superfamily N-acetyltransferase
VSDLGTGGHARGLAVRPATTEDTGEVVRLAALMYEAMGLDTTGLAWRQAAVTALASRLGGDTCVFVADDPDRAGRLAASGAGVITTRLPSPANPAATVGYIQWVSTDPRWRGRGLARAVTSALLAWFAERGVRAVELHATPQAAGLYHSLGFGPGLNPGLRMTL